MSRDSMTGVRGAHSRNASTKEKGHAAPSSAKPNFPHPSAGGTSGDTPLSCTSELTQTWIQLAKTFVLIFPIYALGYFEFSFSWLLIGLAIFFWWRRHTGGKRSRVSRAFAFFEQAERSVTQSLSTSDLPPWVHFPDVERVEWLNKTVGQMWPYICQFVEKLLHEALEPAVKASDPHLSTFCFSKIDIGDKPLRVNGVKVYTENVDKRQIIMDLHISFVGNTEIEIDIKRYYCKAGIKSIQMHGVLRVVMEPLLGDLPLVGALSVFFLKKPLLDVNWTGLTNILDIPGLSGFSDSLIQDLINSYLVLPNRVTVPLVGDVQLAQLRFPMPKALVYEHSGQHLEIELFDEDPDKDDFLGRCCEACARTEAWPNDGLSSALLVVYLDSAQNLPSNLSDFTYDGSKQVSVFKVLKSAKKSSSEPNPFVQLTVGHKTLDSKIRFKSKDPLWEDCFSFLVHNPRRQELEVEVKDDKHKCTLGNLTVPLGILLEEEDMTLTQGFPLKNSGPSSIIKLKMALRILSLEKQVSSDQPSSVQTSPAPTPPQKEGEPYSASPRRSTSSLSSYMSSSQKHLSHKESTPSLVSDISLPFATLELQQRLRQLQNGSAPGQFPLGEVQLTVRHSPQRNKLIVVVHACRNLIAFTKDGSDPFIRLYLLPDKSRTGKRKTTTVKRTLNPIYDQTFEFSVSVVELHRRILDVAVKNGGGLLSKHKGLLGKVLVDLSSEDISKGWTQWYDLSEDGCSSQALRSLQEPHSHSENASLL
ncbi:hypothetical protein fugu_016232 [Takifugu bimaculatus]|uniref:Extended synaptotagmin-like protein 2b n=1 Tax=Takifugu bimaculatus TaxID=433685 RepID=A0A4Z2BWK0_9TELE|nr:hypothetical protein fugu_016232 [Takifugu bimaculatus]